MYIDTILTIAEICIDLHTMFSFEIKFSTENSTTFCSRSIKACCLNQSTGLKTSYFIYNIKMKNSISMVVIIKNLLFL